MRTRRAGESALLLLDAIDLDLLTRLAARYGRHVGSELKKLLGS